MDTSDIQFITAFESRFIRGLSECGVSLPLFAERGMSVGAAVSGGADSVAMLTALVSTAVKAGVTINVVTINHNMRPEKETAGDADFVERLCSYFSTDNFPVSCTRIDIPAGKVHAAAEYRGRGEEEAARFLRYEAFSRFAADTDVSCICLAHNRNDQLETLLMRFLQGSTGSAAAGISRRRDLFVRPLIAVSREDIERYLTLRCISWRTDATNYDTRYLRNRIRNILMPQLDTLVPGWQRAVLTGAGKNQEDEEVLSAEVARIQDWNRLDTGVSMDAAVFYSQKKAVRRRLLYKAFDLISCTVRIPYSFVDRVCSLDAEYSGPFKVQTTGIQVSSDEAVIFVRKALKYATERGFYVIIKKRGEYNLPCGQLEVFADNNGNCTGVGFSGGNGSGLLINGIQFPFCVRSIQPGDEVETAGNTMKSVADVFSSWHVSEDHKGIIPVVQELRSSDQKIVLICGSLCGYGDWVVMQNGIGRYEHE
jgi:tRNA(Ile)-lysidine synthase